MNIDKQSRAYSVPKIIKLPSIEHPVETEFLIPEYCPDIIKILKCEINSSVKSKRIINNMLELECCAEILVVFCGEDNRLSSVITKYNFTKTVENKLFNDENTTIKIYTNHINCRQTAARRIDIKGSINIDIEIETFDIQEVICEINREDIQTLKGCHQITSNVSKHERQIIIEEDLWLGSNKPDVNYIMRHNAIATVNEYKLIGEKVIVKGNIKIDVLYCSVENIPTYFTETLPFSQIIEINNKENNCDIIADADISSFDIKPILSNNTDAGFSVSILLNIVLKIECELELEALEDCYSIKFPTEVVQERATFNKKIDSINEKVIIKKTISLKEHQISKVIDLWCNNIDLHSNVEGNSIKYFGNLNCNLIFIDVENKPQAISSKLDINYEKVINNENYEIFEKLKSKISDCSFTILNDSQIEIQAEILLSGAIYGNVICNYIKEIIEHNDSCNSEDSILIYFCEKEEKVWNIAKLFGTKVEELKEQNNISGDTIDPQSVLLISRI